MLVNTKYNIGDVVEFLKRERHANPVLTTGIISSLEIRVYSSTNIQTIYLVKLDYLYSYVDEDDILKVF